MSVVTDPTEKADVSRYARLHTSITHPQSGNKFSSVSSSVVHSTQSPTKTVSAQNVVQTTQKAVTKAPASIPYNPQEQLQPPTANAQHFIFGVNPAQASNTAHGFIPTGEFYMRLEFMFFVDMFRLYTAGPMLMQILTPQGQPTGQVQYIQFLRPVMVPMVPQPYMQATLHQSAVPSIGEPLPQPAAQTSAGHSIAQQYLPTTTPHPQHGGFYPYAQQPLAAYSSPVASYYHPNIYSTNRVQVVNGPTDLSLNTDEYMPAASEITFKVVKPVIRS